MVVVEPDEDEVETILQTVTKRERKSKKDISHPRDSDIEVYVDIPRPRERKKHRSTEEPAGPLERGKSKLKDVTNSRATLPLIDTTSGECIHVQTRILLAHVSLVRAAQIGNAQSRTSTCQLPPLAS